MIHLPELIQDLGYILGVAAIVTLICQYLKQPVVLGYLIAGFFVGPHFEVIRTIREVESVKVWAEIGVIFLLFGLGLEFSFKKLSKVGKSASITAFLQIFIVGSMGYLSGLILGWSFIDSLFLAAIFCISSTTIIIKAFEELQLKSKRFVSHVVGILIVEDLIAILFLVVLTTIAVSQTFSGLELASSSLRLGFFIVSWFILGIYLLPWTLKKIKKFLSDETLLIIALSLCFIVALLAGKVGFSPALGAFVMGSLFAETLEGHRVEKLIVPLRHLFGAIFFVSVGMLIDPKTLYEYADTILILTFILTVGKVVGVSLGSILSGLNLRSSVRSGMSMAQIGEFSFIIASLGVTLKVTNDILYPLTVAISALTTFTTPYFIRFSDPFYEWLNQKMPARLRERLLRYEEGVSTPTQENILRVLWAEYGVKIFLNVVVVIAITLAMSRLALPQIQLDWIEASFTTLLFAIITVVVCAPFLWAIVVSRPRLSRHLSAEILEKLRRMQFGISFIRFFIGIATLFFLVVQFATLTFVPAVLLITIALVAIYFSRYAEPFYKSVEKRFLENLSEKEREELSRRASRPSLAPWNATLTELIVSPNSPLIAKPLSEVKIKESFGVTVAMIQRGHQQILAPQRNEMLLPFDRVYILGTEDQIEMVKLVLEAPDSLYLDESSSLENFGLDSYLLSTNSPYVGKTIRDCGLRENVGGLIVGLERNGQRLLNPDSGVILQDEDLLWIVGDLEKIKSLKP